MYLINYFLGVLKDKYDNRLPEEQKTENFIIHKKRICERIYI